MMQVKTKHGLIDIGRAAERPGIRVAITPQSVPAYLLVGVGLGLAFGFILGAVVTLLIGNKSLLLAQSLWNRLTGVADHGEKVHFELLLQ